ncbi:MAG: mechanosensitive ion channel family protein [Bacilli bacterium]|nr:mechanosensitive ion channel family protein [Bacilli bacterium]
MKEFFDLLKDNEFVRCTFVVVVGILSYSLIKILIRCFIKSGKTTFEKKKRNTIVKLLENVFKYIIFIIVILFILEAYGVDTKSLIAGIGVAGVVLGLALQDFLKDLISGLSIMLDNYFVIGDIVEFEGFTGEVVEFGLKSTKIRNFGGETLSVANRNIDKIKNLSQKSSNVFIKVPTAYEEKEEKVNKVLNEAIKDIIENTDADESSSYLGIDDFDSSAIIYLVKIHCPQDKRWTVRRESLNIIKKYYDKNNIKIPYTQIEVHNGK